MDGDREETPKTISGRTVVVAMFAFGLVMTGLLFAYWELYTRPFRPLQNAINAAFPGSSPRVIGGEHKSHKHINPTTLRIVISVDFDPNTATEQTLDAHTSQLLKIAGDHLDLAQYRQIEIHLVRRVPESETQEQSFVFPTSELEER